MVNQIPHFRIVVAVSFFVLLGFAVVSGWVLGYSTDQVTKGNIIGTWQNFALLAVGFWIGSSSGGKAQAPSGTPDNPVSVAGAAPGAPPVAVAEEGDRHA